MIFCTIAESQCDGFHSWCLQFVVSGYFSADRRFLDHHECVVFGGYFFSFDIKKQAARRHPFFLFTQQQLLTTEYTQLGLGRPRVALVVASLLFHCSIFRDGDNQC